MNDQIQSTFRRHLRANAKNEQQAECAHRDTGTRQDVASGDPDRWIWWCRDCGQAMQFSRAIFRGQL